MDEATKSRLEELQAEIKLETGKRVTQQELLDRVLYAHHDTDAARHDDFDGIVSRIDPKTAAER